jgi:hypothetical protein
MKRTDHNITNRDLVNAIAKLVVFDADSVKIEYLRRTLFGKHHPPSWWREPLSQEQFDAKLAAFNEIAPAFCRYFNEKVARCGDTLQTIADELNGYANKH